VPGVPGGWFRVGRSGGALGASLPWVPGRFNLGVSNIGRPGGPNVDFMINLDVAELIRRAR